MPPRSFASYSPFPDEDNMEILKPLDDNFFAASAPIPVPAAVNTATLLLSMKILLAENKKNVY